MLRYERLKAQWKSCYSLLRHSKVLSVHNISASVLVFRSIMNCECDVAAVITRLACYRGRLPTGSPLSPLMAFFAHFDVWESIAAECQKHKYILTVYIDDVTISGGVLSAGVLWDIKKTIHRSGLRYHKEKHFEDRPAEITGVIVSGGRILPPNRQLKKLKDNKVALKRLTPGETFQKLEQQNLGLQGQVRQIVAIDKAMQAALGNTQSCK